MVFAFRSQPLRTIYYLYTVLTTLFIRLPYWTVTSLIPSARPARTWSLGRTLLVHLLRTAIAAIYETDLGPKPPVPEQHAQEANKFGFVWVDPVPDELVVGEVAAAAKINAVRPARISGYWFGAKNADGEHGHHAAPGERVVYALHGGGYVTASAEPASPHTNIVNGILTHTGGQVTRVFAVEYRLSASAPFPPANPFPAALMDALAGYRYLVHDLGFSPKNVVITGDSAGAHLAFTLVMYLIEAGLTGLPSPGGLLLLSPTGDWSDSHHAVETSSMNKNRTTDYIDVIFRCGYGARSLCGSLPASDIKTNPYISPASLTISTKGRFSGFPPTCILVGQAELLLDVARTLRDRLSADNDPKFITFHEYTDTIHDWLFLPFEPQRSESLNDVEAWIVSLWKTAEA